MPGDSLPNRLSMGDVVLNAGQLVRTESEELLASSIAHPLHYIVLTYYVNRNIWHAHHVSMTQLYHTKSVRACKRT